MKNGKDVLLKAVDKDITLKKIFALNEAILRCYKEGLKIDVMAQALDLTSKEILEIIEEQKQWNNNLKLLDAFHFVMEERREKKKKTKTK